jgi:hypothetical protein
MKKRSIEPEAVFGQTKYNKQYNQFRHFGKNLVKMDFAIFAIAVLSCEDYIWTIPMVRRTRTITNCYL